MPNGRRIFHCHINESHEVFESSRSKKRVQEDADFMVLATSGYKFAGLKLIKSEELSLASVHVPDKEFVSGTRRYLENKLLRTNLDS